MSSRVQELEKRVAELEAKLSDKEGTYSIFEGDGRERAREVMGRMKGE